MNEFKPESIIRSLQLLTPKRNDMERLSILIRTNKKDYEIIIKIFQREFSSSSNAHKLNLLYLADFIIKTERGQDKESKGLYNYFITNILMFWDTLKSSTKEEHVENKLITLKNNWLQNKIITEKSFDNEITSTEKDIKRFKINETSHIKIYEKNEFSRSEVLGKVSSFFNEKDKLIEYLKGFIEILEVEKEDQKK